MTACTTTGLPSSSSPAASQPSTMGSRSGGDPHPAQRPHVVVVERGGLDRDRGPAVRRGRVGMLAELQPGQRVVGVEACGGDSEHDLHLSRDG